MNAFEHTMASKIKTYDVFIAHGAADAQAAADFAVVFRANGLEPFTGEEIGHGDDVSDMVWEALAESKALVAVISRSELTPSVALEIGAAQAWNKPIYAVVTDPATIRLPASLAHVRHITPSGIEEVIFDLKRSAEALTAEEEGVLAEIYSESGVPVDAFFLDHNQLQKLTEKFNKKSGKAVRGEKLLYELLRMRKRGRLSAGSVQRKRT